ncbi:lyase family protein [Yoonia sp. F2084L]|uniref:lyase family protein n=1 Tax=Yoonia sp. F2084L TaxID=2926419 RepID=UPI001FF228AA|nr:lyase family protein [Yoonia sp. F2084L]MCK0096934.1 lyase family protein [Yoonia sp. F2084L]
MIDTATHPWLGDLLGDTQIAAIFQPDAELRRLLKVEAAWTRAIGSVAADGTADRVAVAIENAPIDPSTLKAGTTQDGVPIPALVRLLRDHVGPDHAALVHTGMTSQDVMDTSLMLALGDVLSVMENRMSALDQQLLDMQAAFKGRTMPAYTRMQPALQTTVHDVIGRWRNPFERLMNDARDLTNKVRIVQWGGPIGARDHAQAQAIGAAFAENLGLRDPGQAWHTDRSVVLDVAYLLSRISIATGKIGEDVCVFALAGAENITFTGGGSSAMPHKNNPVKAEALVALADFATVLATNLNRSARHEGFRSGRAWTLEWLILPQLCASVGAGTLLAAHTIEDIISMGAI